MMRDGTFLFDWALQVAALVAVLFVFNAGVARGAMRFRRSRHPTNGNFGAEA